MICGCRRYKWRGEEETTDDGYYLTTSTSYVRIRNGFYFVCVFFSSLFLSFFHHHHHHHQSSIHFPCILSTSISNTRVPPGGMPHAGNPPCPYPSSAGMHSSLTSPNCMPKQPWSHPVMTLPTPASYVNGCCPLSFVDQNFAFVC